MLKLNTCPEDTVIRIQCAGSFQLGYQLRSMLGADGKGTAIARVLLVAAANLIALGHRDGTHDLSKSFLLLRPREKKLCCEQTLARRNMCAKTLSMCSQP